jgi:uncharacterized delta-60 repeat protein
MLRTIKILLALTFITIFCAQGYSQQWAVTYGNTLGSSGGGVTNNKAYAVAVDKDGFIYVTGFAQDTETGNDFCTIKYDPNGDTVWVRKYDGPGHGDDKAYAITVDQLDNIIVVGYVTNTSDYLTNGEIDIATIKYDKNGVLKWERFFNGQADGEDKAYAITVDPLCNIFVGGSSAGANSGLDFVTLMYTFNGRLWWSRTFDGPGHSDDVITSITNDGIFSVIVTGFSRNGQSEGTEDITTIKYNTLLGIRLWTNRYDGSANGEDKAFAITVDKSHNVYVAGFSNRTGNFKDIITIRYDSDGDQRWAVPYNGSGDNDDIAYSIVATHNERILVSGSTRTGNNEDSENFITIRYKANNGDIVWNKTYDGAGHSRDVAYSMALGRKDKFVYVTGSSRRGHNISTEDMLTLKYNVNDGELVDQSSYNGNANEEDVAYDVALDANDNVYITGYTTPRLFPNSEVGRRGSNYLTLKYHRGALSDEPRQNVVNQPLHTYKVLPNYPNPFNPVTHIMFELPKANDVRLSIFDVTGREIEVLVNSSLEQGTYDIEWDASRYSSGTYFFRIQINEFTETRKMILVK